MLLATPVFTHYELARRCLEAGKHTFVEKPLASSTSLAEELIALSEERDASLMCGIDHRPQKRDGNRFHSLFGQE